MILEAESMATEAKGRYSFKAFNVTDVRMHWRANWSHETMELLLEGMVVDRETKKSGPLVFREELPLFSWKGMKQAARDRWVRGVVMRFICHEVDECLLVAGERVWDPHKGER